MATNDFLPFAGGVGANVQAQAAYAASAARPNGFVSGVADSTLFNKVFRQGAAMAAALGEYLISKDIDALDNGDIATLAAGLRSALDAPGVEYVTANTVLTDADRGKTFVINAASGPITITLPTVTLGGVNFTFTRIDVATANSVTIVRSGIAGIWGTDDFDGAGSGLNSVLLRNNGATIELISSLVPSVRWLIIDATGYATLASPGYFVDPSGLVIQWGSTNIVSGSCAVTFPLTVTTSFILTGQFASLGVIPFEQPNWSLFSLGASSGSFLVRDQSNNAWNSGAIHWYTIGRL